MCGYVYMSTLSVEARRGHWSPGAEITGGCEPHHMDARN